MMQYGQANCIHIRVEEESDAEKILDIYRPYVEHTAISFEYEAPDIEEFRERVRNTLQRYPYLVAEDQEGILGYAYAGVFKGREAYDRSVETTVYVKRDSRQSGIGSSLYTELEHMLKQQGILNLYACIAYVEEADEYLTQGSVSFHEKMGYQPVGRFHKCGYKFNRWYDMIWMEKFIGEHGKMPECI